MYIPGGTFKTVLDCANHMVQIGFQYFLSGHGEPPALTVCHFFRFFMIAHPALNIVKHAKSFVNITGIRKPQGIIAKQETGHPVFQILNTHHTGQQDSLLPVRRGIIKQCIIVVIFSQSVFAVTQPGLFEVLAVQIHARRRIGRTEIHGNGHGEPEGLFYHKFQQRNPPYIGLRRNRNGFSMVNPVKQF